MNDKELMQVLFSKSIKCITDGSVELRNGCILTFDKEGNFIDITGEYSTEVLHKIKFFLGLWEAA